MTAKSPAYTKLAEKQKQITHLGNLGMLVHWDSAAMLKPGSAKQRQQETATLTGFIHSLQTSEEFGGLIDAAEQEIDQLDSWDHRNLQLIRKNYDHATCLSEEVAKEHSLICTETEYNWRAARSNSDFKKIEPYFDKLFDSTRKIAEIKSEKFGTPAYDILIDSFDPERSTDELDEVFGVLRRELPILLKEVHEKQSQETILPLKDKLSVETQKQLADIVMRDMGFDMDRGRIETSTHPFCIGSRDDVRMTSRYDEENFISGLLAVVHETGHGIYQQNLPEKYKDQPVGGPLGMAFHESQSMIMELQVGIGPCFSEYLSKTLADKLSIKGPEYSSENLLKLMTRVKPSFIRVDADEVTYPLHVILRYEIEQEIINNKLEAKDLPELWNSKMHEYLGITPKDDAEGVLQDIHWPMGMIGYFPAYSLGAITASMLMKKARETHDNIDNDLRSGDFSKLNEFLNKGIREHGRHLSSRDLLKSGTGHDKVSADIFLEYLRRKYL